MKIEPKKRKKMFDPDDIIDFSKVDKPMSKKDKSKITVGKNKKNSKGK
jgi:hypothetical protein